MLLRARQQRLIDARERATERASGSRHTDVQPAIALAIDAREERLARICPLRWECADLGAAHQSAYLFGGAAHRRGRRNDLRSADVSFTIHADRQLLERGLVESNERTERTGDQV